MTDPKSRVQLAQELLSGGLPVLAAAVCDLRDAARDMNPGLMPLEDWIEVLLRETQLHPTAPPVCDYYCCTCGLYMSRAEARGHNCIADKLAHPAPTSSPSEDLLSRGSSACPVCGRPEPHAHSALDVEKWANSRISAWGFFSKVFHKPNKAAPVRDARWRIRGELFRIYPTTGGEWGWIRDGMPCSASEATFLENNEFEWVDNPEARVFDAPKHLAPSPSEGKHEGATAAEWASRYASLAEATYPVLAWLPRNDPGARMVAERLEGVLAGQPRSEPGRPYWHRDCQVNDCKREACWHYCEEHAPDAQAELTRLKEELHQSASEAHRVLCVLTETQAELTRLKEENARLSGELDHLGSACDKFRVQNAGLWRKLDDARSMFEPLVHRAESMMSIPLFNDFEAALSALDRTEAEQVCGTVSRSGRMSCTEPPGHDGPCADKGDAFAVATPPESVPAEAPREIRVGSRWRHRTGGAGRVVASAEDGYVTTEGVDWSYTVDDFRDVHTWLSDPEPPAERPVAGEEKL